MSLHHVFQPIAIGNVEIPNRIVRTAHLTGMTVPGKWDDFIAYHAERARGGCGLYILEAATVHPSNAHEAKLYDDEFIPHYRRLMIEARRHGMRVFQQLWHGGHLGRGSNGRPPYSSSDRASALGTIGVPMGRAKIDELIQAFASAASRCLDAGLDGVEVHAAHGYIFHQFLSPAYNDRTDEYGGSLVNRMRLLREVLRAIRQQVGRNIAVGARFSCSETLGGVTAAENREVIQLLQDDGLLDFVDVSFGDYYRLDALAGGMHRPAGYELPSSGQLTQVARVPTIVAGRFRTVNASAGSENVFRDDEVTSAQTPRRVLVVGGGAAGMEAARIASLAKQVLLEPPRLAGDAVVVDEVGSFEAIGVAEFLISRGLRVTYVTSLNGFAPGTDLTFRGEPAFERLYRADFRLLIRHQLVRVAADHCIVKTIHAAPDQATRLDAALVVPVLPQRSDRTLFAALSGGSRGRRAGAP